MLSFLLGAVGWLDDEGDAVADNISESELSECELEAWALTNFLLCLNLLISDLILAASCSEISQYIYCGIAQHT